ncbi:aldo/keto reductase [Marisediminicola antarctica]|uniref:Aldo/keto reductase n=1 Tax=Marisediminicola antarctica TaxID=674079 RepID=A0A7L5AJI8_9MICO|nr:aldo/keto reductase [Marisediminicola antarctica]QHO69281.1 aldo/keto reductase [Marisediminicola antarctica]
MRYRRIGDVKVSAIGLGAMPLSIPGRPDRDAAIATIHAALDAGVTLIDTADAYTSDAQGHNEELVASALAGRGEEVLVATKGGLVYRAGGPSDRNGTPEHLKAAARASAKRLGVDAIGLYQLHRPDPGVPWEESVGALRELQEEGVIRLAGVSNATTAQIRSADHVLGGRLASVQNQFSPSYRSSENELDYCAEHEIAFLAWGPLGGASRAGEIADAFPVAAEIAAELSVSPQRVILAWELALQHTMIAIPGARRPASIRDSARAADLVLTADQIARLST